MKTMQTETIYPICLEVSVAIGNMFKGQIFWPGGRGWLEVQGTFAGANGKIVASVFLDDCPVTGGAFFGPSLAFLHPDFVPGISAGGIYRFEAPPSTIVFVSDTLAQGDTLSNISMRAIRIDRYVQP